MKIRGTPPWRDRPARMAATGALVSLGIALAAISDLRLQSSTGAVDVKIRLSPSRVELEVLEKEVFFDASRGIQRSAEAPDLVLVRERARAAGGQFELIVLPGGGYWAALVIPTSAWDPGRRTGPRHSMIQ